jgi:LCP family protein required for cell wall assembly
MENNDQKIPRRTPRYRSLDGFVQPNKVRGLPYNNARNSSTTHREAITNERMSPINNPKPGPQIIGLNLIDASKNQHRLNPGASGATNLKRSRKKKLNMSRRRIAAVFLSLVLFLLVISGGWISWKFLKNASKIFGGSIASNISSLFDTTPLKGEDVGRVNILLAGDSADDPNHGGAQLTDSIMIVSIDTKGKNSFMLSVPRDLWVIVPTLGHNKINAANEVTTFNVSGYPQGGMGALEQIAHDDLGIPINYYALIDYSAFRDAVNAVGGIPVNIQSTDPRGLFDPNIAKADGGPLKLPNGWNNLNGQTALNLARARGDPCFCGQYEYGFPSSDFDRTQHQRQMLIALAQKGTSIGVASNPLKVGQIFDSIGNNVKTDLSLSNIRRLVKITKGTSPSTIQSTTYQYGGINPILTGYYTPNGQDALIPAAGIDDFSKMQLFYQKLTSNNPVVKEGAKIVVLNGTSTLGLAKTEQTKLMAKGIDVVGVADASKIYPTTTIIDNSAGKLPATLAYLKTTYGNNVTTKQLEMSGYAPDFIIIIGTTTMATTTPTTN